MSAVTVSGVVSTRNESVVVAAVLVAESLARLTVATIVVSPPETIE